MHRIDYMTLLSIIPTLPFVYYGVTLLFVGLSSQHSSMSMYLYTAIILAFLGVIGLLITATRSVQKFEYRIALCIMIFCGHLAIVIAISGFSIDHFSRQALLSIGHNGGSYPIVQVLALLLILSWPISTGAFSIYRLIVRHA